MKKNTVKVDNRPNVNGKKSIVGLENFREVYTKEYIDKNIISGAHIVRSFVDLQTYSAMDNAILIFQYGLNITATSTITLAKGVKIYGNNSVITKDFTSDSLFIIDHTSEANKNLKELISGLTIIGKETAFDNSMVVSDIGIKITRAYEVTIDNCLFISLRGCGITFQGDATDDVFTNNAEVKNCKFEKCYFGISHTDRYEYSKITNNFFSRCRLGILSNSGNWLITNNSFAVCEAIIYSVNKTTPYGIMAVDNFQHGQFLNNCCNHSSFGGDDRWVDNLSFIVDGSNKSVKGITIDGVIPPLLMGNNAWYSDITVLNVIGLTTVIGGQFENSTLTNLKLYGIYKHGNNVILVNCTEI